MFLTVTAAPDAVVAVGSLDTDGAAHTLRLIAKTNVKATIAVTIFFIVLTSLFYCVALYQCNSTNIMITFQLFPKPLHNTFPESACIMHHNPHGIVHTSRLPAV